MASAWIVQKPEDVRDHGEAAAPHYVGWYEPDGRRRKKSCGTGFHGKKNAERLKRKLESELMTGTYQMNTKILWEQFVAEYDCRILAGLAIRSRQEALDSLARFKRVVKPIRVFAVNTGRVDDFVAARRQEPGKKKGELVSPATVNKDPRQPKAALRMAREWGYVADVPRFRMLRVPEKLPTYVTPEHFTAIYQACDHARRPGGGAYLAADWWRGLIVTGCMAGWRIGDMLGLLRDDLDLDAGTAVTRWDANKGKRDERVKLHPAVVEHLKRMPGFTPAVFPWPFNRRTLDVEFTAIQRKAGIHLPCTRRHEHTPACHTYGFHDLRRAFATINADRLSADALQKLMRHRSYPTTRVYINMARQMDEAVANLHVPAVLKAAEK